MENDFPREPETDRPADKGVADGEKPRRQRDGENVAAESGAPTKSGSSSAPAGILDLTPMTAPTRASASVASNGPAAKGGNQSIATGAAPPDADHARATTDATSPTHATRRYCMTATSLMSPPKASAISTIAVAAPGEVPQTAVVPGSTLRRVSAKPRPDAKNMTAPIKVRNIGHLWKIVTKMSGVMLRATRQPTKPWATTKAQGRTLTRPSNHETRIAAAIAPSRRAAGRRISSKAETQTTEAARSVAHCRGGGVARRDERNIPSSGVAPFDKLLGRDGLDDAGEESAPQVDQHERGRFRVKNDHPGFIPAWINL